MEIQSWKSPYQHPAQLPHHSEEETETLSGNMPKITNDGRTRKARILCSIISYIYSLWFYKPTINHKI